MLVLRHLRWAEVDPASHVFDAAALLPWLEELLATADAHRRRGQRVRELREAVEEAIDLELIARHGVWVAGWRWAATEPGGGGPVQGWCCSDDSLLRSGERGHEASLERVLGAVAEWRRFLEELAAMFAALRAETRELPLEEGVERAAARLLPMVLERTSASDAWYGTFERLLCWYLESAGLDPDAFRMTVAGVVSGRFHSWIAPATDLARSTCTELSLEVGAAVRAPVAARDALAAWLALRPRAFINPPAPRRRRLVVGDGHLRHIEGPERERDGERAGRMASALAACRASALRGEPLTFERLAQWQRQVLGRRATFRTGEAFAKGGRERYALEADTSARFEAAVADASEVGTPVAVRAARVYLDVCFFHPFDDGNARAARLALDHVLTSEGLALHAAEPLLVVSRSAADPGGPWALAWMVESLVGPRDARADWRR